MTSPVSKLAVAAHVDLGAVTDWDGVLDVKSSTIQLSDDWAPYCQAEIVIAMPPEVVKIWDWAAAKLVWSTWAEAKAMFSTWAEAKAATYLGRPVGDFAYVDPRQTQRVTLTMTQEWAQPVRSPQTRTFDLMVREREIDHVTGLMTIKLESDEGGLIDAALVATSPSLDALAHYSSLRAIVNQVLEMFDAELEPGTDDFSFASNLEALVWQPGITAWNFLAPLVQTSGLRLFCDEQRRWWLVESSSYRAPGQLRLAASVNLTRGRDLISRYGDWFDSVVVKYTWPDQDGATITAYDAAGGPGTKTRFEQWERPFPGAGAAAAILERAERRGRTLALDALADTKATPGMNLLATLPNTPIQSGMVAGVTWQVVSEGDATDIMTIESRGLTDTPPTAWLLAEEGMSWSDVAPGVAWNEYTP